MKKMKSNSVPINKKSVFFGHFVRIDIPVPIKMSGQNPTTQTFARPISAIAINAQGHFYEFRLIFYVYIYFLAQRICVWWHTKTLCR
jgi:hypothetical protein